MTEQSFKVGDRVKVRDEYVSRYVVAFAKYITGRPGTVIRVGSMGNFRGRLQVEFDVKRKGAAPKREWFAARELEIFGASDARRMEG